VSAIDREGEAFDDSEARRALFAGIRASGPTIRVVELDLHINDEAFADAIARELVRLLIPNSRLRSNDG